MGFILRVISWPLLLSSYRLVFHGVSCPELRGTDPTSTLKSSPKAPGLYSLKALRLPGKPVAYEYGLLSRSLWSTLEYTGRLFF